MLPTQAGGLREREEVASDILRYFQTDVRPVDFPKHEGLMLGGELRLDRPGQRWGWGSGWARMRT